MRRSDYSSHEQFPSNVGKTLEVGFVLGNLVDTKTQTRTNPARRETQCTHATRAA